MGLNIRLQELGLFLENGRNQFFRGYKIKEGILGKNKIKIVILKEIRGINWLICQKYSPTTHNGIP